MSDLAFVVTFLVLSCGSSALLAFFLPARRPSWSRLKVALISALPFPGLVALLCLFVFGNALRATLFAPDSCGVDACGMAMGFSLVGLAAVAGVYAVAALTAACTVILRP
jgi:hypothetical protein